MATKETSSVEMQQKFNGFIAVLTSAACEWFLIFLLLLDAALSYLLTKFARYCKLQIPCILCSRLDHVFGKERPDCYRNLLCSNHRLEISSLLACQIHGKLADGCSFCDDCLLSLTTKNKPNPDMQRPLMVNIGFEDWGSGPIGLPRPTMNGEFSHNNLGQKLCSCCNKPWRSRHNAKRLLQVRPPTNEVDKPNIPLPRRVGRRENLKRMKDKVPAIPAGKSGRYSMSHVGYRELKIHSETESEIPFSDDDYRSVFRERFYSSEASDIRPPSEKSFKKLPSHVPRMRGIYRSASTGTSPRDPHLHHEFRNIRKVKPSVSRDEKIYSSSFPELISLDDILPPSSPAEFLNGVSPPAQNTNSPVLAELASLDFVSPSFHATENHARAVSQEKPEVSVGRETESISINKHDEIMNFNHPTSSTPPTDQIDHVATTLSPRDLSGENQKVLSDSAINTKEKEASSSSSEQLSPKEHRVDKDLKLSALQNVSTEGSNMLLNDTSNSVQIHDAEKSQISEPSTPSGVENYQQSDFLEGTESIDGSVVSEIEGESLLDRLKRQVEYDKKRLYALSKELEEERNASSIAANQAMAMITRLQEEKAALRMEGLQYLRMMEEQAEYDMDALDKTNDLLTEKEKEVQDLEAELEILMLKLSDAPSVETTIAEGSCDLKKESAIVEKTCLISEKDGFSVPCDSMIPQATYSSSSWQGFEDEKRYISECLKTLEKRLYQFSQNPTPAYTTDGGDSGEEDNRKHNQVDIFVDKGSQIYGEIQENHPSMQNYSPVFDGDSLAKVESSFMNSRERSSSVDKNSIVSSELNDLMSNGDHKLEQMVVLENEISDLHERLEALEADYDFLERSFSSLENGKEGLLVVEEIANGLHELRKLGIRRKCQSVQ